jgi:hypothetical protein
VESIEWVTQLLRQGDAKVFKKYSQMKLQMKREALQKLNRHANEGAGFCHGEDQLMGFCHGFATVGALFSRFGRPCAIANSGSGLKSKKLEMSGRSAAW